MVKEVTEASHAVAEAARQIRPDVVAAYPITPQTHIVERISDFVADGEMDTHYIRVESEFSAISACLGASAAGSRAYTATASQGIALMHEVLFIVSGMRLPVGMTVVNRALSAPINIWNDHQDSIASRDAGWIQMYAETAQEAYDLTIQQFKISEDHEVLLPSMACLDGFTLSHVYEPVSLHTQKEIDDFLPAYKPLHAFVDPDNPLTQGPIGFPEHYMELRADQHKAMNGSLAVIEKVMKDYSDTFPVDIPDSRPERYYHVEEYKLEDAEYAMVAMGSLCGTAKDAIDALREKGEKVGLLKVITYRPFPKEVIYQSLKDISNIAVLEKAVSPGAGGILYQEVGMGLADHDHKPNLRNFIVGLGGRDVTTKHIIDIYDMMKTNKGNKEEWMF